MVIYLDIINPLTRDNHTIIVANGSHASVAGCGNIKFPPFINLQNVLHGKLSMEVYIDVDCGGSIIVRKSTSC